MKDSLALFAIAMVFAWTALPLLAFVARGAKGDPAARQYALTLALVFASLTFFVPWVRVWTDYFTAFCMKAQSVGATLVLAPTRVIAGGGLLSQVLGVLGALALCICAIGLARLVVNTLILRSVVRSARPAPAWIVRIAEATGERIGVRVPPVRISSEARVPFAGGGAIVLPESLSHELDEEALELIFAHELLHVKRRDVELAWLVAFAKIPFVGHPMLRWISREIACAREQAVDAIAGADAPHAYARVLVDVASTKEKGRGCPLVAMEVSQLARRISELIAPGTRAQRRTLAVAFAGCLVLAGAMIAPRPAESRPVASAWGLCVDPAAPAIMPVEEIIEVPCEAECSGEETCDSACDVY